MPARFKEKNFMDFITWQEKYSVKIPFLAELAHSTYTKNRSEVQSVVVEKRG